ncbi:MAG: Fis family transcriptional regulator [Deltaproteobacteria bacterium RBG_13_58_19]|nr:MAG: Fis family transcriptional regulator [Deltaproteobacteria bacterium RBG_13_58_19]
MNPFSIFVIDDEESIRQGVSFVLKKDYRVKAFATAEAALETLKEATPDLILLDIGLPGISGIEALGRIKEIPQEILVIMITAYEDIDMVIKAMKMGAHDYIVKPIQLDLLRVSIKNALETIKMRKEIQALQERYLRENMPCFIGESDAIQDVMNTVAKVAQSPDTPVIILGESGTGKELIASAIHYKSPNFQGPFVTLNCAAIPRELLESELFGYEKGAFSGAAANGKKGLVEQAGGGTLFLDEVGDLSLEAQAKLLRFLENGEFYRLGGTKKLQVRTRVVSATNKDINSMIEQSLFREDLYYRLAVIKIWVPSLNNRPEDIVPIAKYFLVELSGKYQKNFTGIAPEAESLLKDYAWKGNIRELRNIIERGVLMESGPQLRLTDLDLTGTPPESSPGLATTVGFPRLPDEGLDLAALEKHFIKEALKKSQGNSRLAADLLRMSYYAFRYKRKNLEELKDPA